MVLDRWHLLAPDCTSTGKRNRSTCQTCVQQIREVVSDQMVAAITITEHAHT